MRIVLTGASGQLGREILMTKPKGFEIFSFNSMNLNFLDYELCKKIIYDLKPEWIINCGAYTAVDLAEKEKEKAFAINYEAPKAFAEALLSYGGKILQLSTDFVFDGQNNFPYKPEDERNPINNYGLSKAKGEIILEDLLSDDSLGIILRTSWLMSPIRKNFLLSIIKLLNQKDELSVISDIYGSPSFTFNVAPICWEVIQKSEKIFRESKLKIPILHCSDSGVASWYDIATSIAVISKELGLVKKPAKVIPIKSSDYYSSAKRPKSTPLDCSSTYFLFDQKQFYWEDSIYRNLKLLDQFN